jgi:hypothetical protein
MTSTSRGSSVGSSASVHLQGAISRLEEWAAFFRGVDSVVLQGLLQPAEQSGWMRGEGVVMIDDGFRTCGDAELKLAGVAAETG